MEVAPSSERSSVESSSVEVAPSSERSSVESVERGSETAEPQQDSRPNLPEPSPLKVLSDALKKDDALMPLPGVRGSGHFVRKRCFLTP